MAARPQLKVEKRELLGSKVKCLRREGVLPANVYGKNVESLAVQVDRVEFEKLFRRAGETDVIELLVKGEKVSRPVLVHGVQLDPVSDQPIHVDLLQVDLAKKVRVDVPVKLVGESAAVKAGNVLLELLGEIEVEALPAELPSEFEVDISSLTEVGAEIKVKDLTVPPKVETLTPANEVIAKIEAPAAPQEEAPEAEAQAVEEETPPTEEKEARPAKEASRE